MSLVLSDPLNFFAQFVCIIAVRYCRLPTDSLRTGQPSCAMDGKIIVFTGTLQVKRADAKKMAEDAGATVAGNV